MDKVRQIHGIREESSTGFVDDMDELRRELDKTKPSPPVAYAMGQESDPEGEEDEEQFLTLGDGLGGQELSQQGSREDCSHVECTIVL